MASPEVTKLTVRMDEIRDMDKSNMTSKEKSSLNHEMNALKKDVRKEIGGYVYLGTGTLILIIILVILLL